MVDEPTSSKVSKSAGYDIMKEATVLSEAMKHGPAFLKPGLSDYALVLLATSFLEQVLRMSFLALFRKNRVSNTLVASVFEGKGPLATFSAKVDVCIGLGTIPDYRHDLKIINTVRNKFAHSATELHLKDFDNCRTLKASAPIQVEEGECLKRQKFKQACAAIISHICNASLVNIAEDRFVAANPEGVRKEYEVMLKEAYSAEAPTE